MNCMKNECKFLNENYNCEYICTKNNVVLSNILIDDYENGKECNDFEQLKSCNTCSHSYSIYYDDDCEDYHCKLQNRKMIYSDIAISAHNNSDFPSCNINKWKSDGF